MASHELSPDVREGLRSGISGTLAQAATRQTVLGERRVVVVLVARVRINHHAAGEDEDVLTWADEALRLMLNVIHRHAGTIDSFTADGMVALFGVPVAHEDDAHRAAHAALAIVASLRPLALRLRHERGSTLDCTIGLHRGPIIHQQIGFGELEYTVIGDTLQCAVRLNDIASDDPIVASAAFAERTRGAFAYAPVEHGAMGLDDQAFVLLGEAALEPSGTYGFASTRLVGRAPHLARLVAAVEDVRLGGVRRVVVLSGDAGIGKSRLVDELCSVIAGPQIRIYRATCSSASRVAALSLAADLVRGLLGAAAPGAAVTREALGPALERLGLAPDALLPYLDHALGEGQLARASDDRLRTLDPAMLQRQTHLALRQVVLAIAHAGPTVFILEDLHWLDPASRDFLDYLIQTTQSGEEAPFALVLVTRDTAAQSAAAQVLDQARKRPDEVVQIALDPLSPTEGQALIEHLLGQPGEALGDLVRRLADRAAGNPLYMRELVSMLSEHGVLVPDGRQWTLAAAPESLLQHLPDTLYGLLAARFAGLPERLRRLLQRASVLGRVFSLRLLARLDPASVRHLTAELAELTARQLIVPEFQLADGVYAFANVLFQEAVYQTVLLTDRQRLHGQAAQAIAADSHLHEDDRVQLLAHHYVESTEPELALPFLLRAAERNARRAANETAIQQYRRALALMDGPPAVQPRYAMVQIGLGRVLKYAGSFDDAATVLGQAVAALRRTSGEHGLLLAEGLRELAEVFQRDGHNKLATDALDEGLALLATATDPTYLAMRRTLIDRMAALRFRQGDLDAAYELASEAAAGWTADAVDDPATAASLHNTLGGVLWQRGDLSRASWNVRQSLELYARVGYSWGMATAYTNLGVLSYTQGLWSEAAEHFERSDRLRREIGYMPERAVNLKNLGVLQMETGDHEHARRSLETSLALSQRIGDDYGTVVATLQLVDLLILQRNTAEARAALDGIRPLLTAAGEDEAILYTWLNGLVEAADGQLERGVELVREALGLALASGVPEFEIDCRRVLGALLRRQGAFAAGEVELQHALTLSREHNNLYRQGLALYELGWLHSQRAHQVSPPDPTGLASARANFEQAGVRFGQLSARYDQGRVRAALSQLEG